jgi:hypothetical protein
MATPPKPESSRIDRVLAAMVASIIGLSLICFAALLIASAVGVKGADFAQGIWPTVAALPLIGLPIGFVMLIILIVLNWSRRRKNSSQTS